LRSESRLGTLGQWRTTEAPTREELQSIYFVLADIKVAVEAILSYIRNDDDEEEEEEEDRDT
jgi:hypothetical protein